MKEYPKSAAYLGVAGVVVQILSSALLYLFRDRQGLFMSPLMGSRGMAAAFITMGHSSNNALLLSVVATFALLAASLYSILLMTRGGLKWVKLGSFLLIVLALLSATTTFGIILGSALMFVSGVAGIAWAYTRASHL